MAYFRAPLCQLKVEFLVAVQICVHYFIMGLESECPD